MQTITYPYKASLKQAIFVLLVGSLFSGVFYFMSQDKLREMTLFRAIPLNAEQTSWFNLFFMGFFGLMAVVGVLMIYNAVASKKQIQITDEYIASPKGGIFSPTVTVMFSNIRDIKLYDYKLKKLFIPVAHILYLQIIHDGGKLHLSKDMLPNKAEFNKMQNDFWVRYKAFKSQS